MREDDFFKFFVSEDDLTFLPAEQAMPDGLIGIGGDLSVPRLMSAYRSGIFPWYDEGDPILWWSPDPRFVLFPQKVHVSESMRKILRRNVFSVRVDTCFDDVIRHCSTAHGRTWIVPEMIAAYNALHRAGYAHSVEVFHGDALVGGLYGVSVGNVFCGESMFSLAANASKTAFIIMALLMCERGVAVVDCQFETSHLASLGGENVRRSEYLHILKENLTDISPSLWLDAIGQRTTADFVKKSQNPANFT